MFSWARTGVTLPACHGLDKRFSPKLSHTLAPVLLMLIGVDPQCVQSPCLAKCDPSGWPVGPDWESA
jgi:hypothetical protein